MLLPRTALFVLMAASLAALAGALALQYLGGLHPCHLCILQRWPHGLAAAAAALGLAWPRARMPALALCALLLLAGAGVGVYHTGVEYHWFPGPTSCTSEPAGDDSLEALRAQIYAAPLVACDQAAAHFLGLSLAAWNAAYSFLLAVYAIYIIQKYRYATGHAPSR